MASDVAADGSIGDADVVRVGLGARSYDVIIAPGLIERCGELVVSRIGKGRCFVVTDTNVAACQLEVLTRSLERVSRFRGGMTVAPGEASKRFDVLTHVCEQVLEAGVERGDLVVALGGGVVGDLAGFAAAIVRRGVRFVQIPTSLLAQVDSSVGGKTGINTPQGKNLVGAFHQPSLVLADTSALTSLPDREMRAGYAEVAKYGLLGDASFYGWLEDNAAAVLRKDEPAVRYAVRRSVEMKAEIVARDETEQGDRALLNLGHTFGHALEAWTGYSSRLLHGEGVSIGMCLAYRFSERLGHCPPQTAARVAAHLKAAGLPTRIGDIASDSQADAGHLLHLMGQDKKVRDGQLTLILARGIGSAFITREVAHADVHRFLTDEIESDRNG
ncbi:MAG: 3-dehydroquinate synthase [Hyphomicrobiaceae bacterium]|nr:3-dehydroquinate synthase [Hyphomicrobiaceae bacterium]